MPNIISRHAIDCWDWLSNRSQTRQTRFFDQWKDDFKREDISSLHVKRGDHLAYKMAVRIRGSELYTSAYEHHFICTNVRYHSKDEECNCQNSRYRMCDKTEVEIIEYTGLTKQLIGYLRTKTFLDFTGLCEIRKNIYTYKELKDKNTVKVIWPSKLERFNIDDVIARAKTRESESYYDILRNNCESFVTWCKCGLNVSLQVEEWYEWVRNTTYSFAAGALNGAKSKVTPKLMVAAAANVSDEIAGCFMEGGSAAIFIVGGVLEVCLAGYKTYQAWKQYGEGVLIRSKTQLATTIATAWVKGACRFGGGCLGSVLGLAFGPSGSLVGGAIGAGIGHFAGSCFEWAFH